MLQSRAWIIKLAVLVLLLLLSMLGIYAHYHGGLRHNACHMLHKGHETLLDMQEHSLYGGIMAGKTINCLGDSITEGYKNDELSWVDRLPMLIGAHVRKYGIGGSTISAYVDEHPMCQRYADMDAEADCVVIFAGNNDFTRSVPLGDKDSRDEKNFYGALNIMLSGLRDKYPKGEFLFVTPLKMWHYTHPNWKMPVEYDAFNEQGLSLNDYRKAIIDRCEYYGIPVLDMYTKGIYGRTDKTREMVYVDGLHPNDKGHRLLARQIARALN